MRFAIVDDELFARNTLKKLLAGYEAEIYEADNGYKGYLLYKNIKPDIIFVDLLMPGEISGEWLIEKILNYDPNAKIVVCSGRNKAKMLKYKAYGCEETLPKPIKYNELINTVDRILKKTYVKAQ